MAEQTPRPRRPDASMSLLTGLLTETLDPGYAQAAERRAATGTVGAGRASGGRTVDHGRSPIVLLGVAAMALVLIVAAIQTHRTAPATEREAAQLRQRIQAAEAANTQTEAATSKIRAELQAIQAEALGPG